MQIDHDKKASFNPKKYLRSLDETMAELQKSHEELDCWEREASEIISIDFKVRILQVNEILFKEISLQLRSLHEFLSENCEKFDEIQIELGKAEHKSKKCKEMKTIIDIFYQMQKGDTSLIDGLRESLQTGGHADVYTLLS